MTRLSREEQHLIAHKPAASGRLWRLFRFLPWSASTPVQTEGLAEIIELAVATETEHIVGMWLQRVPVLTEHELGALRALGSTLPAVPKLDLSQDAVLFVLNGWRNGAGNVEKW